MKSLTALSLICAVILRLPIDHLLGWIVVGIGVASLILNGIVLWAIQGTIPRKKLAQRTTEWLRRPYPNPDFDYDEAVEISIEIADSGEQLPGSRNAAVVPYLMGEHDAEMMEILLDQRVFPHGGALPIRKTNRINDHAYGPSLRASWQALVGT